MTTLVAAHYCAMGASSIDQSFDPSGMPMSRGDIYENYDKIFVFKAQTFTVGALGFIDRVDVFIGSTEHAGSLWVDIRPTSGGVPLLDNGSALAALTLSSSMVPSVASTYPNPPDPPDWVTLDFSGSPIPVVPGQQLALVLRTGLGTYSEYYWYGVNGDPYSGGSAYMLGGLVAQRDSASWSLIRYPSGEGAPNTPMDHGFRIFVTPVPEPQTLTLLAGGSVFGLALYAFQRKRNPAGASRLVR